MFSKQTFLRAFVLIALAASAAVAARANTLDFTLTGQGTDITFTLNSDPTVSSFSNAHGDFVLSDVVLDANGHNETANLAFYTSAFGGGFEGISGYSVLLNFLGTQLFTGALNDPTFKTGDFSLQTQSGGGNCNQGSYNLNIVDPSAVTPEPSSILLMATGALALVGAGVGKRYAA